MRTIILVFGLLAFASFAQAARESRYGNRCSWSSSGKSYFDCEDKPFVYGYIHCADGMSGKIFCKEKDASSVSKCATDDQDKRTRRCRDKLSIPLLRESDDETGRNYPVKKPKFKKQKGDLPIVNECSSGVVKGYNYACSNGAYYFYNEVSCNPRYDGPQFCESTYKNNPKKCEEDVFTSSTTRACFRELFGAEWNDSGSANDSAHPSRSSR